MTASDARKTINCAVTLALEQHGWNVFPLWPGALQARCGGLDVTIVTSVFAHCTHDEVHEARVSVHSHLCSKLQMNLQSRPITEFSPQSVDKLVDFVKISLSVFVDANAERLEKLAAEIEES